jgi:hypothetical protein
MNSKARDERISFAAWRAHKSGTCRQRALHHQRVHGIFRSSSATHPKARAVEICCRDMLAATKAAIYKAHAL